MAKLSADVTGFTLNIANPALSFKAGQCIYIARACVKQVVGREAWNEQEKTRDTDS